MPVTRLASWVSHRRAGRAIAISAALMVTSMAWSAPPTSAAVPRVDLRVLVLNDGSPWVTAIASQLAAEGVPYTSLDVVAPGRAPIDAAMLSTTDHAKFQAVVAPSATSAALSATEWATVRAFEAQYSIREVDAQNWPDTSVGLATPVFAGDMNGMTATVTPAAQAAGFQYLSGPVPFSQGSWGYLATPLTATTTPALPAGASFVPLVTAVAPIGAATTSVVGVYTHDGVEQMVITALMAFSFPQFKTLAHGIVTWMTRGVHLGYQRNYLTFHVDDAFSSDALWDSAHNCTPGEDCPLGPDGLSIYPESSARMTADDVAYAVQWQASRQYTLTLAFNGLGIAAGDPLTTAFQSNQAAFKWLNHGLVHVYQGCAQDFTTVPWHCVTDANGAVVWMSQADVQSEISTNITAGRSIGLTFDTREYLSGEHSGLAQPPQQLVDNPNFAAAVAAAGITSLGADASRESGSRIVGGARTVPRHPTALYYNTSTAAAAIDEYNWLYTSRANGGSGYCEDNAATATCIAPLNPVTGFTDYIVPTDAAFDLGFVLSNDPRPFYAHTSNLTGDRLLYPLVDTILTRYRTSFAASAPLVNLTLTDAATTLTRHASWTAASTPGSSVNAWIEGNVITVSNPSGLAVPLTVPTGTTLAGGTLQSYGGEQSTWLTGTAAAATLPSTQLSIGGSASFLEGRSGSLTARSSTANASIEIAGTLPAGLVWASTGPGAYALSGVPAAGTAGTYPVLVTATSAAGVTTRSINVTVNRVPTITSASSATVVSGVPFSFTVAATGVPVPVVSVTGTLPSGVSVRTGSNGTATVSGTPTFTSGSTTRLTVRAVNSAGTTSQTLTLTLATVPRFTSSSTRTVRVGVSTSFSVTTSASPRAAITALDALPSGLTFRDRGDGTALITGVPAAGTAGTRSIRLRATNVAGSTVQTLSLTVQP